MYSIKNILSLIIFVIFFSIPINSSNSQEKNYYQDIVNDWNKIFPDRNRNAAGPKFFKYIIAVSYTHLRAHETDSYLV